MTAENAHATAHHDSSDQGKKYFSVEEANRALPYVSRIMHDVSVTYDRLIETRRKLEQAHGTAGAEMLEAEYETAMDELGRLVDELHEVGVELKDFEKGLLDFPALHEGREVQLCWLRGQEKITHWHEVDAGYVNKQPVAKLKK